MVNGEVFLRTQASIAASGMLTIYAARGVKQCWTFLTGSDIIIPISAAFINGLRTIKRHSCIRQSSSSPHICWWGYRYFGMERTSRKAFEESLVRERMHMLVSPRRSGWVSLAPVMVVILVLSEDSMVPRTVAPQGNWVYRRCVEMMNKKINRCTYLHFPSSITCHPLRVHPYKMRCHCVHTTRGEIELVVEKWVGKKTL